MSSKIAVRACRSPSDAIRTAMLATTCFVINRLHCRSGDSGWLLDRISVTNIFGSRALSAAGLAGMIGRFMAACRFQPPRSPAPAPGAPGGGGPGDAPQRHVGGGGFAPAARRRFRPAPDARHGGQRARLLRAHRPRQPCTTASCSPSAAPGTTRLYVPGGLVGVTKPPPSATARKPSACCGAIFPPPRLWGLERPAPLPVAAVVGAVVAGDGQRRRCSCSCADRRRRWPPRWRKPGGFFRRQIASALAPAHARSGTPAPVASPRVFVDFKAFLADWRGALEPVRRAAGTALAHSPSHCGRTRRKPLRRSRAGARRARGLVRPAEQSARWIGEVDAAVQRGTSRDAKGDAHGEFDRIAGCLQAAESLYRPLTTPIEATADLRHVSSKRRADRRLWYEAEWQKARARAENLQTKNWLAKRKWVGPALEKPGGQVLMINNLSIIENKFVSY